MLFLKNLILASLSAIVFSFAIPNEFSFFGSTVLGFVSLIPLYFAFLRAKSWKQLSVLFGSWVALTHLISSFWLAFFRDFAIFTLGASTVAYFFLAAAFGPIFYLIARFKRENLRPFAFAIVWVFWEWFKSTGFLAYPWGTIPMTVYKATYLKQIVDISGVWGISFLVSLCSFSLAELLRVGIEIFAKNIGSFKRIWQNYEVQRQLRNSLKLACYCIFLCAASGIYSAIQMKKPLKQVDSIKLAIIQANSNSWSFDTEEQLKQTIALTEKLLDNSKEADLILWNEGSLIYSFPLNLNFYKTTPTNYSFSEFISKHNTAILAGTSMPIKSISETGTRYYADDPKNFSYNPFATNFFANSVCLISANCEVLDSYNKMHLVPFAENMPFIESKLVRNIFRRLVGFSSAYLAGDTLKLMSLTRKDGTIINFATPICFEDAFPRLCASLHNLGSELLINLTDDSWSQTKSAEYQHFVVASYRSIELRTTLVRSTNSGYSCIVDPKGMVTADLPLFTAAGLYKDVPIYEYKTTFYARFKDWLPILSYITIILCAVYTMIKNRAVVHKKK